MKNDIAHLFCFFLSGFSFTNINSLLPLPPNSRALRYQPGDCLFMNKKPHVPVFDDYYQKNWQKLPKKFSKRSVKLCATKSLPKFARHKYVFSRICYPGYGKLFLCEAENYPCTDRKCMSLSKPFCICICFFIN